MLFFNYSTEAPYMNYGVVDANNELVHYTLVHCCPVRACLTIWRSPRTTRSSTTARCSGIPRLRNGAYAARFHPGMPMRLGVIPRRGGPDDIRWFEAESTFVLHWVNAFEDGDEIVLDGFFQGDPEPVDNGMGDKWERFRFLALDRMQSRLRRWRLSLVSGLVKEDQLRDTISEFGTMNLSHAGRACRCAYAATSKPAWFLFDGLVKHDTVTGLEQLFHFGDGVFGSETAMAPRVGSTGEDDGYLVTLTTDMNGDASYCDIFDAKDITVGPICKLRLPGESPAAHTRRGRPATPCPSGASWTTRRRLSTSDLGQGPLTLVLAVFGAGRFQRRKNGVSSLDIWR
ncbi:MAG: carotenoid oxygenase family protein [Haloechinothrix sp.]